MVATFEERETEGCPPGSLSAATGKAAIPTSFLIASEAADLSVTPLASRLLRHASRSSLHVSLIEKSVVNLSASQTAAPVTNNEASSMVAFSVSRPSFV